MKKEKEATKRAGEAKEENSGSLEKSSLENVVLSICGGVVPTRKGRVR